MILMDPFQIGIFCDSKLSARACEPKAAPTPRTTGVLHGEAGKAWHRSGAEQGKHSDAAHLCFTSKTTRRGSFSLLSVKYQ